MTSTKHVKIIENLINIVIVFLLSIAILNIFGLKDNLMASYNYKFITIFSIVYIGIMLFIIYFFKKHNKQFIGIRSNIVKLIVYISIIAMQIIYAVLIYRKIGWDAGMVYGSACDLVNGTFNNSEYFSMYGNNVLLLLFLEILFRIVKIFGCSNYLLVAIIFNIFMVDLAIYYIYKTCAKLGGKKYGIISYLISIPMLGFSPYIAVVYSDTLSYIFPIIIFYNYICYKDEKESKNKIKLIFKITCFSILGYLVKPTNVIILIAIFVIETIFCIIKKLNQKRGIEYTQKVFNKEKTKYYIINAFVVFFTILVIYGGFSIYENVRLSRYISKELIEQNSFPMTHFMMMGLKPEGYDGKYYGVYLEDDVNNTKLQIGKSAKKEYNVSQIKSRLKSMGSSGYLSYLYDKYTFIISDGTFFYGNEGSYYQSEPYVKGRLADFVQELSYVDKDNYKKITLNIMQSYWVIVISLILISSIINLFQRESGSQVCVLKLSIVGIIMFILLFEARSRYLMNYLPIFIALAVYSMKILEKINVVRNKENKIELLGGKKEI